MDYQGVNRQSKSATIPHPGHRGKKYSSAAWSACTKRVKGQFGPSSRPPLGYTDQAVNSPAGRHHIRQWLHLLRYSGLNSTPRRMEWRWVSSVTR
ncbi:hypothetical protein E2C01_018660 [Portunus trituberculatus]|uniref:Uncharacterized protein n=1 Tax=Portunus trituberculatus TaxID=210409 RepID=A0A5B7DV43_PORTR|nr:hypothetical protein [Portunus trituberculatus]